MHVLSLETLPLPLFTIILMEQFEERWVALQQLLLQRFGKMPDTEGILFLIGINELGSGLPEKFTKEQKQDLMHVAVCTLLSQLGYFVYLGRDEEGWPHFEALSSPAAVGLQQQEQLLKECMIRYFEV